MQINNVKFIKGILGTDPILFDGKKQIAFVGRSNVGKSSTINSLLNKKAAYISKKAGKTREINLFLINELLYFVDLPGYGYAKVSKTEREKLGKHIFWYLTSKEINSKLIVIIVDSAVGLTDFDIAVSDICEEIGRDYLIVFNKFDKLNQSDASKLKRGNEGAVFVSAKTQKGIDELRSLILK